MGGADLSTLLDLTGTTHTNAGTYNNDPWTFTDPAGNYTTQNGTVNDLINKAIATINVTAYSVTYDGNPHTATGTATGVGGVDLGTLLDLTGTTHTNAATYNGDPWTFTDPAGNYTTQNGTVNDLINKATATINVTAYTVTYDGNPHTASGTATGVGGVDLSTLLDLTGTTHTNAGTYNNDPWTFTDPAGNYTDQNGTVNDLINKATAVIVVTPYTLTYDGNAHTATGTATGVENPNPVDLSGLLDLSATSQTNASDYPADSWTFAGNGNYNATSGTVHDVINKATAVIVVTPYSLTYDGNAHTATGTATGVENPNPVDLTELLDFFATSHTNAGDYSSDSWIFEGNSNYNGTSGTVHDVINKAIATINVTAYSVSYDGNPHTASGTATGVGGADLSTLLDFTGTTHTSAGTYNNDPWTFTDPAGNYTTQNGSVNDLINKAIATINVTAYSVTYDGNPHTATGTATGVGGVDLSTLLDLTGTTHTNAGTYNNDPWTFTDPAGNYTTQNGSVNDLINKAIATINVTAYSVTYDGNPHTATGTATGVGGVDLSTLLDLTGTTHTNAATYNGDPWTFTDPAGNYTTQNGSVNDLINKAIATINVTAYSVTYDGNPHTATGTATGVGGVDLSTLLDLTGTTHTNAATYNGDPWTFTDPAGNYTDQNGSVNDLINKATAVIVVTPYTLTYDGNAHTATGTATGVENPNPVDLTGLLDLSATTHTNASDYPADSWTFAGNGNYNATSGTVHDVINKATAVIVVTPYALTYDGNAHTATGTATGVENPNPVDLTGLLDFAATSHTNASDYPADTWTFAGNGNYNATSGTVHDVINKAIATINVTAYSVTYDGNPHTATGTATGVGGADLSTLLDFTGTTHTSAGTYNNDPWTFTDPAGNYTTQNGSVNDLINKATATINVTAYTVTYDGNPHTASGTATGVGGVDLSTLLDLTGTTHTNAGTYNNDPWTFTDPAGNYTTQNGTVNDLINKAIATINVTAYSVTYDGNPHTATGTATGVGGVDLSTLLDLTGTTHTNAATYNGDPWTFTDPAGNYTTQNGSVNDLINKAIATINVTAYSVTYDGNPHTATGTATGVGGADLSTLLDLTGTTHTNAGTYNGDPWTFTDPAGNYTDQNGSVNDLINKATAVIVVTPYTLTYDGNAHTATGTATGVENPNPVDLSGLLDLSATTHTNASDYPADSWTFAGNGNYNATSGTVHDVINKATAVIVVTPYSLTYDGNAHTATGTATGVENPNPVDLTELLDFFATSHTNAGDYSSDSWIFEGNSNYNGTSGTVHDVINKAIATINVTAYSVSYDGNPHTATGTATGVGGADLSTLLDLTGTTHTNAGTYNNDPWTFTDPAGNYTTQNGTVNDLINKAIATINVTAYSVTYDGNPHTATGTATGVGGVDLSTLLDLTGTTHTNAATYNGDPWTFTDPAGNYTTQNGSVNDLINKATATINVTAYSVTYDGNPHTATGTATGVGGVDLGTLLDLTGTTHTNAATYNGDPWTFTDPAGNYTTQNGTVNDLINKATATINVTAYTVTYDGNPHTATGTATGVGGADLSTLLDLTGTTHTNAGTYNNDPWTFTDPAGNYTDQNGTVNDLINKATAVIVVTPYTLTYDGNAHTATGTATGVENPNPVDLSGLLDLSATSQTNASDYPADSWTFAGNGNYNATSGTVHDVINKATAVIVVTPYSLTYDGNAHTATGTATGVENPNPVDLTELLDFFATSHTNAGDYSSDSWIFEGNSNYNGTSGTVHDVINKAIATINVTAYSVSYDGNPHTASGTATGVGGADLSTLLDFTGTTHTSAGTYNNDPWTFTDPAGNYTTQNGSVNDLINKAIATINVTAYSVTYDGNPHTATGTATGVGGVDLSTLLDLTGTTHTNAGTYNNDPWTFTDPAGNYTTQNGSVNDLINKAIATINVTAYSVTYDGNPHTATGTATGVGGVDLSTLLDLTGTTHTNAATYNGDPWTFTDPAGNYTTQNGSVNDLINKAIATINVTAYSVTYDGNPHTATGTATGVGGADLSTLLDLTGTTHTNAATYNGDPWTFTDPAGNYTDQNGSVNDLINKATAVIVVTPYTLTYDGNAHTATGTATGVENPNPVDLTGLLDLSATTHTNASDYPADSWTFAGNGNYNATSGTVHDVINKATAVIVVTPYALTYDGNAHTATGTATGVENPNPVDLTGLLDFAATSHTNASDYPADTWTFAGNGNYNATSGTVHDVINKAIATINVTAYSVTYDGNPHTATGTATGVGGADLSTLLDFTGTTHTSAGTYNNDPWTFTDPAGNYTTQNGSVNDLINKATATINVTAYTVTYDGNPHTASGTATGVGGVDLSTLLDLTGTTHTNAGTYNNDPWTFTDPAGNYTTQNGTVNDLINKAIATINVTAYSVTYDGNPHTATGTATGVGGVDLSTLLDLTGTTHTNAATYNGDPWTFTDPAGNYTTQNGSVNDLINKAIATINVTAYSVTYDGNPHTATGTATGVGGADLSTLLDLTGTTHTNAGTYNGDPWTFTDPAGNYTDQNGSVNDLINKATAVIVVTPYSLTYDGNAHTATGTATGVENPNPVDLSGLLDLSATTHTNASDYPADTWTFAGNGNYNATSGTVHDVINKATAVIVVTPYALTYDGNAHTATGTATGVENPNPVDLSGLLDLSATTHTNASDYPADTWTFAGNGNYNATSGTVHDVINKAIATINVTAYSVTYDGNPHTATGTATGVGGADLSTLLDFTGTTHTSAGTYNNDPWTFTDPAGNYATQNGSVNDLINRAIATINVTAYSVNYDGNAHTATGTATGVGGVDLSTLLDLTGTTHTNAGTYNNDPWTFTDPAGNYTTQNGSVNDLINKAIATINVTAYSVTYDGNPHTATGTATGVGGADLSTLLDLTGTTHTNAATYNGDSWTFTDPAGNYTTQNGSVNDLINKATATINVTAYSVTYDGNPHTATGTATGVGGVDLSTLLDLTGTTHTNAATYNGDPWTFTDPAGNYTTQNGSVNDLINKATAVIVVTPYTLTYDGNAHTATGTATGVENPNPVDLSGLLDLSATSQTNASDYPADSWTFAGNGNYNATSGTVHDVINKATAVIVVTPYSLTYDGNAHTATGTATGVENPNPVDLTELLDFFATSHTNAGDYSSDSWIFEGNSNYNGTSGTVHDVINKAIATINVTAYSVSYDGNPHTATGTATGVGGADLSTLLDFTGTTHTTQARTTTIPGPSPILRAITRPRTDPSMT